MPAQTTTSPHLPSLAPEVSAFCAEMAAFREFGQPTRCNEFLSAGARVPVFENEFWTAKQREGHSLHEISYRACFKPSLPAFFIRRFTAPGDTVYDPFMGRGTTLIEAALLGRRPAGNDVNPLAIVLAAARLAPPTMNDIAARLAVIPLDTADTGAPAELLAFYHPETLREIAALRSWFITRRKTGTFDAVDAWLQMVATNRLTGHSPGFFSVYTLPPNQATSVARQNKINAQRRQTPPRRDVRAILLKKSRALLKDPLPSPFLPAFLHTGSATSTPGISSGSVALVVTSPPFLDIVQYKADNWLRAWFCDIPLDGVDVWEFRKLDDWIAAMSSTFTELHRILRPGGIIAFEVGEVRKATIRLEEEVVRIGQRAGLAPECVLINTQNFTKTSNCWGITNNKAGTNSNRIVLLRRAQ